MAKLITAENALGALIEKLVNPTLAKLKPFAGARAAEHDIANQMEAVAWLYNQYLCQEIPNLEALDWEDLCNKASTQQTRLSKFLGAGRPAVSCSLTPTEHKVKNACETAKALRAPTKSLLVSVTKICVCLLNFRQDKCVLALGATTVGVWSFIEKDTHAQCSENGSSGGPHLILSDDDFAFKAVQEQTGIKADVLQIEEWFLINDNLNGAGGSTKFFIMSCMGTFDLSPTIKLEKITWVSLDLVFSKTHGFLIDASGSSVRTTPAVEYFHLRPFCSSVESWLTRQHEAKSLVQRKHAAEKEHKDQNRTELLMARTGGNSEEKSGFVQEQAEDKQGSSKPKVDAVGLKMQLFAPTGSPQSSTGMENTKNLAVGKDHQDCKRAMTSPVRRSGEKLHLIQEQVEDKRRQSKLEVNAVCLNTQFAPTMKNRTEVTQFAPAMKNRTEVSALMDGESIDDISVKEQEEDKAIQVDQTAIAMALDMNVSAPNRSPQSSTKIKKREEEHILDKAGALLSLKTAYRNVRKKRKVLCKELREHTIQTDMLYKQIAECDAELATLMGGGKAGLQLAIQLCKTDGQKPTSSSDVSIDQSQPDAVLKCSRAIITSQAETSNKKRPFQMLKSSVQELNEVCTRNEWPLPSYGVFSFKTKQRQCVYNGKVKIRGNDFELSETGEASETAKAAKLSAAAYMLSTLHLLRARNATL